MMLEEPQRRKRSRYSPLPLQGGGLGRGSAAPLRTKAETLKRARELRKNMTEAEKRLWYLMRRHNLETKLIRRQVPVGDYIIDFACLAERLLIEIDGGQHAAQAEQDARRTAWLEQRGFRVIRFWNNDVLGNTEGVLEMIVAALKEQAAKRPRAPSP
jgi:very-short-patch-repair endonuclease